MIRQKQQVIKRTLSFKEGNPNSTKAPKPTGRRNNINNTLNKLRILVNLGIKDRDLQEIVALASKQTSQKVDKKQRKNVLAKNDFEYGNTVNIEVKIIRGLIGNQKKRLLKWFYDQGKDKEYTLSQLDYLITGFGKGKFRHKRAGEIWVNELVESRLLNQKIIAQKGRPRSDPSDGTSTMKRYSLNRKKIQLIKLLCV